MSTLEHWSSVVTALELPRCHPFSVLSDPSSRNLVLAHPTKLTKTVQGINSYIAELIKWDCPWVNEPNLVKYNRSNHALSYKGGSYSKYGALKRVSVLH